MPSLALACRLGAVTAPRSIPRRVRSILNKYGATMLLPGAAEPILGPELVVNGAFDSASGWGTVQPTSGSVSISGGVATITSSDGSWASVYANPQIQIQTGKTYQIQWELLSATGAGLRVDMGGVTGIAQTSPGIKTSTATVTNASNALTIARGGTGSGSADNISVREILGYQNTYSSFIAGNYKESTGQTLAAADQQVGLVVDAARAPGPEICPPTTSLTGWSAGVSSDVVQADGYIQVTNSASAEAVARVNAASTIAGAFYEVVVEVLQASNNGVVIVGGRRQGLGGVGLKRYIVQAQNTEPTNAIRFGTNIATPGGSLRFRLASARELPGIHASQSTSGFQPVLRRGLVNQLLWSSDFSNAVWGKTNLTLSGSKVIENTSSAEHFIGSMNYSYVSGQAYSKAVVVEAGERTLVRLAFSSAAFPASNRFGYFNLANGTVDSLPSGVSGSIASMGDGKYLCVITRDATASATTNSFIALVTNNNPATISYPGDGTSGIYLHSAALFQGCVTAEEIIAAGGIPVTTTAPASSVNGVQSWQFDSTDDRLSLSAVPFQMADDHFVVAGCRVDSLSSSRTLFSISNASNHQAPYIYFNASGFTCTWFDGAATRTRNSPAYTQSSNAVCSASRLGNAGKVRLDGVQIGTALDMSVLSSPATTVGSIGSFNNISQFFNGHIHGVIFGKGAISDSELLTLERFMATLQGRTL